MSFWGWVGAIAAGWFVASVVFAIGWRLVGRVIFRKPPTPVVSVNDVISELERRNRLNGRRF